MLHRAMSTAMRPIYGRIHAKVTQSLAPTSLVIKDESFTRGTLGQPFGRSRRGDPFKVEIVSSSSREAARREAPHGVRAPGPGDQGRRARAIAEDENARGGDEGEDGEAPVSVCPRSQGTIMSVKRT